jgi:hypothetical protein
MREPRPLATLQAITAFNRDIFTLPLMLIVLQRQCYNIGMPKYRLYLVPSLPSTRQKNFLLNLCGGTLGTATTTGLLYQPRMIGDGDCGEIGGMKICRGNRSTQRKPAPATNPTWRDPGLNPGRRGGKPATNRLSYGAAYTATNSLFKLPAAS